MATTITLQTTFLALASVPATSLHLGVVAKVTSPRVMGKVNQYAGGRFRAVSLQGLGRSLAVTFTLVDEPTRAILEAWAGQLVCYRDPQGLKLFGVYFGLTTTAHISPNVAEVATTITEATYSEAV